MAFLLVYIVLSIFTHLLSVPKYVLAASIEYSERQRRMRKMKWHELWNGAM